MGSRNSRASSTLSEPGSQPNAGAVAVSSAAGIAPPHAASAASPSPSSASLPLDSHSLDSSASGQSPPILVDGSLSSDLAATPAQSAVGGTLRSLPTSGPSPADLLDRIPVDAIDELGRFIASCDEVVDVVQSDSLTASFVAACAEAAPRLMSFLGELGQHAPLVGVAFAALNAAGRQLAATGEVTTAYNRFYDALMTTARLLLEAESHHVLINSVAKRPLDTFWVALSDFVALIAELRGARYIERLWSHETHKDRLTEIERRVQNAKGDLLLVLVYEEHGTLAWLKEATKTIQQEVRAARENLQHESPPRLVPDDDRLLQQLRDTWAYWEHAYILEKLALYVPPYSSDPTKAQHQQIEGVDGEHEVAGASSQTLLFDRVQRDFLDRLDKRVLVLKGRAGTGKSMFGLWMERHFAESCQDAANDPLLVFVTLPHVKDPIHDLIMEYFTMRLGSPNAATEVISWLKRREHVVFVLDGWDEIPQFQTASHHYVNLFASNRLHLWTKARFIVTCRTDTLERIAAISSDRSYQQFFAPIDERLRDDQLVEAQVALFDARQMRQYVDEFVRLRPPPAEAKEQWTSERYLDEIDRLSDLKALMREPLLLEMTVAALPVIVEWHTARQEEAGRALPGTLTKRDVFLAFLKESLNRQEGRVRSHSSAPPDLKTQYLRFLLMLAAAMQENSLRKVQYRFAKGEFDDGPQWARKFFGDPFQGKKKRALDLLEQLRHNLTCLLVYEAGVWHFLHDSFVDQLNSIQTHELSLTRAEIIANGGTAQEAEARCVEKFAVNLFESRKGPYITQSV